MSNPKCNSDVLIEKIRTDEWKNDDAVNFFENIPIEVFRNWAIKGGFENGCDIDLVYPYIATKNSILEIGAAYGRVIENLIRKGFSGKIYAIERSKNFYKYLLQHHGKTASIIHSSIQNFEPKRKFDAILWMWSGIGDFAKNEQLTILKRVSSWLHPGGTLVLETLLHTLIPKNATLNKDQSFMIESEHGIFYSHKPSKEEISEYGEKLGFKYIKHVDYETTTLRHRIVHLLSNAPI